MPQGLICPLTLIFARGNKRKAGECLRGQCQLYWKCKPPADWVVETLVTDEPEENPG